MGGGDLGGGGHRGATALPEQPVPSLPARSPSVSPPTPRESTWGPLATLGSQYLLLLSFFKEKKIILLKL